MLPLGYQLLDHPRINLPDRRKAETDPLFSTRGATIVSFPPSLASFHATVRVVLGLIVETMKSPAHCSSQQHPRREDVLLMRSSGIFSSFSLQRVPLRSSKRLLLLFDRFVCFRFLIIFHFICLIFLSFRFHEL